MSHEVDGAKFVRWDNVYRDLAVYLSDFVDHDVTCGAFSDPSGACTCGLVNGLQVLEHRLHKDVGGVSELHKPWERVKQWSEHINGAKDDSDNGT